MRLRAERRPVGWLAVPLASLLWFASAQPASASTTVFAYTGGEQTYTVPAGVHSIHVVAIGARGGRGEDRAGTGEFGGSGGLGDRLEADLAVEPGQLLFVEVGGNGGDGGALVKNPGVGGFNGGGKSSSSVSFSGAGGGGGGATDIRTCSMSSTSCPQAQDTLSSRLLVAGGGGGGSEQGRGTQATGGEGGDAGAAGGVGQTLGCNPVSSPGLGGLPGTQTAGGAGGGGGTFHGGEGVSSPGQPGAFGTGGSALPLGGISNLFGGGGGGGYYGGGAGGGANGCRGGGGAGGSSFAAPIASVVSLATGPGDAQVIISIPEPKSPPKPSNIFSFGKLKLNKHAGTGTLAVNLPGPGTLSLNGSGLLKKQRAVAAAGMVGLPIMAKGKSSRLLERSGRARLAARVTFTPAGGEPNTKLRAIRLIKTA